MDLNSILYKFALSQFKLGKTTDEVRDSLREENISEDLIKDLIAKYLKEFKENNKEDVIRENPKKEQWFGGPNETPESHWSKLKQILFQEKGWSQPMIEDLSDGSNSVISELANPKLINVGDDTNQVKGLVLGYVQSGKTANYSAVISKALDAGYKFIIVLAGIHNNLRYQTEVRLREEIIEPSELITDTLTRSDKNGDFTEKQPISANKACGKTDGFTIAVLKKNSSVLRKFNIWLEGAKKEHLDSCPILLIDDEADQASLNTSKDPELNATAINSHIRNIISKFKTVSYVGYTATPFANILIDSTIDQNLFPKDFIVALKKPVSYIGAQELFGSIGDGEEVLGGLPLIREIPDDDSSMLLPSKNKSHKMQYKELPQTLKFAIKTFLLAGAIRITRGHLNKHISMLVHSSFKIYDQQEIHKLIDEFLGEIKFLYRKDDSGFKNEMQEIFENDFLVTSKKMDIEKQNYDFEVVWKNLEHFIYSFEVIIDNSASDKRLSFEDRFWGIVVGGNTLSRGLTIEGLTCSYFIRSSKMYDTLMQMGRWFGYRPGYLDLKRIFITNELRDNYFNLACIENEIREEIRVMAENHEKPLDVRLKIRKSPQMIVTAKNKAYAAKSVEFSFAGRKVQPKYVNLNSKNILKDNKNSVDLFLKKISESKKTAPIHFKKFKDCTLFRGVSREEILQFLDSYRISPANTSSKNELLSEYIIKNNLLDDFSVVLVSQLTGDEKIEIGGRLNAIPAYRSLTEFSDQERDPGARYISSLSPPPDEMIDLEDQIPNSPESVDDLLDVNGRKVSYGYLRKIYRPKNRPLLLIYPIKIKDSESKINQLIYAICFIFPENDSWMEGNYIVNATI